jgi:hypothetical protein
LEPSRYSGVREGYCSCKSSRISKKSLQGIDIVAVQLDQLKTQPYKKHRDDLLPFQGHGLGCRSVHAQPQATAGAVYRTLACCTHSWLPPPLWLSGSNCAGEPAKQSVTPERQAHSCLYNVCCCQRQRCRC